MTLPSTEDSYLIQCIAYIDLNMVRVGVARHSRPRPFCQYNEIQNQRQRSGFCECGFFDFNLKYSILNHEILSFVYLFFEKSWNSID